MLFLILKYGLTAAVAGVALGVAKRSGHRGSVLASLPLATLLVAVWLVPDAEYRPGSTPAAEPRPDSTPAAEPRPDSADVVFDPGHIHDFALTMSPKDWLMVRDKPEEKEWVTATFTWNGKRLHDIGVRTFGQGSLGSFAKRAGKPSLKLSFDRNVDGQELSGLDELKLDNSAQDPGYLNEYVATAALRRAGVPASRTGWARLTVNGEFAGFFVVLESIDDRFVERWFGHEEGALYSTKDGNYGQGLNRMTNPMDWYESETKHGGNGTELARAAEVLATGSMSEVKRAIDLPGFFRESVARSILGSQDSFSADGSNFYLFDDRGQIKIIPWDFDSELGTLDPTTQLKVDPRHPWTTSPWAKDPPTHVPYTDPVLKRAIDDGADVDELVHELVSGPFEWKWLDAYVAAGAKLIEDDARRDVLDRGPEVSQRARDLRLWLHARLSALSGHEVDR